ncbi:hypothetical protein IEQ34_023236 [Dendrobium chrysotoxum]|uniref:Uncharacterized protein n=1 Tax=Dendrobium chrysotoxum TaxID=161865 RepID=A0AAV7FJV2_DENCH|nr:hypothetical protein IEQ34_024504 [Dendrobium chrysotoxum]KAH0447930.1 hypothetical protein IEQ34_023236 [Dendrobium chrysotoxum]
MENWGHRTGGALRKCSAPLGLKAKLCVFGRLTEEHCLVVHFVMANSIRTNTFYSAWQVYLGKRFFDYAVLGDDIVITGDGVAQKYAELIEQCEATISKE